MLTAAAGATFVAVLVFGVLLLRRLDAIAADARFVAGSLREEIDAEEAEARAEEARSNGVAGEPLPVFGECRPPPGYVPRR